MGAVALVLVLVFVLLLVGESLLITVVSSSIVLSQLH